MVRMVWSFTTHTGASWSTAFLGLYSFIAGISTAEELFCLKGNYNIPTAVLKLRQTVKKLNFSQSDNLEKNDMQECTAFCFDHFTCLFWSGWLTFLGSSREKTAQIWPSHILKLRNLEIFLNLVWHLLILIYIKINNSSLILTSWSGYKARRYVLSCADVLSCAAII